MASGVQLCDDALWAFEAWRRCYLDALQHVQEELVASELDSLPPPADPTRHLAADTTHLGSAVSPIVRATVPY